MGGENNPVKRLKDKNEPKSTAGAAGEELQIKIDPKVTMNRESFMYLLVHTLQTSGQLPLLNLVPAEIKDNALQIYSPYE
ncbi:hypothetical protein GRF59_02480 [Paenibacillus sp. HJL G12]|uniref:Uncharacterized protein n=1 Tax=Paenibacillus dendrobii TaxID=2691084 RepID=A0A7X3LGG8_9BACL|nr:hypothetical protein [Paenibacillus dendrobii]MWV42488.1 hypothetical protein [Paenibacillus dendrobii]